MKTFLIFVGNLLSYYNVSKKQSSVKMFKIIEKFYCFFVLNEL